MSNIPFLDRTTHDTFRLRYIFNSSEPSDNVNPLHVSDQILNTANKWSKKSEFMLFRLFQASFAGSRPIRRGPDSFALASFTPSYGPFRCYPRSKCFERRMEKSSLPFQILPPFSFFANSRFYCSPPRNNDKNSRINTQKRYIRNEKSGVTVPRERERAKERERRKLMEMTRKQRKRPVGIQKTKEASFRGVEESTGRGEGQN